MVKRSIKVISFILIFIAIILIATIAPIDRTPLPEQPYYSAMMNSLDTMEFNHYAPTKRLQIGWSKKSILPNYSMPMAGYTPRSSYESIHDSLYVRTLAISNGSVTTFLISLDLLLFPPTLTNRVNEKLMQEMKHPYFVYYSATHTHNGTGGWDPSMVGQITMGEYHNEWIETTSDIIVDQVGRASSQMKSGTIGYIEADANAYVYNRIDRDSNRDGIIRGLKIVRDDSTTALLVSYSAHPTSLSRKSRIISGDYPTYLIEEIEKENNFGMFMAGMMGSHGLEKFAKKDFELIKKSGKKIGEIALAGIHENSIDSVSITTKHIPLYLGPSQLRIAKDFRVRDWVLRSAMRPLHAEITLLEIGDVLLLGTSCDFSGEIYVNNNLSDYAAEHGKMLMITSFNGNYTGYITADHHYETLNKEEVRIMNWVGPYADQYYTQIIERIIQKLP